MSIREYNHMTEVDNLNLINLLKAIGDESRMRIINILRDGSLCVCEIEAILDMTQSNASRHLNKLTNAGIVSFYKEAKFVYYKLNEETLVKHPFIKDIIWGEIDHIEEIKRDYEKLAGYRSFGKSCEAIEEFKVIYEKIKKVKER